MNVRGYAVMAGGSHLIGADTASRSAEELASYGWLVEVRLISEREPDLRFFAVGTRHAHEAEEAILRYPGLVREAGWGSGATDRERSTDSILRTAIALRVRQSHNTHPVRSAA